MNYLEMFLYTITIAIFICLIDFIIKKMREPNICGTCNRLFFDVYNKNSIRTTGSCTLCNGEDRNLIKDIEHNILIKKRTNENE